jgi:phosphoribosylaminoimidazole-succinocarboxamide synthase
MTYADVATLVGAPLAAELQRATLEVYRRGAELAAARGVIIADTKLEFGLGKDGTLMLGDEVLTPDSSRFWLASEWQPGRPQRSLDKQFVRDWSAGLDWDRRAPGPVIPPEVVAATQARYEELFTRVTSDR